MVECNASPVIVANSMARRLGTGKAPGSPKQTGQTLVLGAACEASVRQPQNILDVVRIWAWTSRPIVAIYFMGILPTESNHTESLL